MLRPEEAEDQYSGGLQVDLTRATAFMGQPSKGDVVDKWYAESRTMLADITSVHHTLIKLSDGDLGKGFDDAKHGVEKHAMQIYRTYGKFKAERMMTYAPELGRQDRMVHKQLWEDHAGEIGSRFYMMCRAWDAYRLLALKTMDPRQQ